MLNVYSDPSASTSPLIQQGRDVSTFRVNMQYKLSELRTLQEYRSRSVLQGISQVGGLWTFLTGVFAAIFGSTIIRILFGSISESLFIFFPCFLRLSLGIKRISFLGLAHSTQQKKIRKACHEEYPKIKEQIRQPASERGLLSFICDQLIDVEFLDDEVDEANDTDAFVYQEADQVEMSQL